jgi:fatty acid synthase subunit alpha
LPDKAEEIELEGLSAQLQASPSFSGQLRKVSIALTTRLFSLKMPGGFNAARARGYLGDRWGLGSGRQDSVFFLASTMQPAARLASESDAQAFFDGVVKDYAAANSLSLSSAASSASSADSFSSGTNGAPGSAVIDSQTAALVIRDQEARRQADLEIHAKQYGIDLNAGEKATLKAQKIVDALQEQLDFLSVELGDVFTTGIRPLWAAPKIRRFDSSWNWVFQDTLEIFYALLEGKSDIPDRDILNRGVLIANRSNPRLMRTMQHMIEASWPKHGNRVEVAKGFLTYVMGLCESSAPKPFVCYDSSSSMAPLTTLNKQGKIQYLEVPRPANQLAPGVHIKTKGDYGWIRNEKLTNQYLGLVEEVQKSGMAFSNKNVLVTGASLGSIGAEMVRGLLAGGARVIVTTSNFTPAVTRSYQETYMKYGSKGSELIVLPFNQGSQQDIEALVLHIYDPVAGLGWDLDHVIPLAAISENGREIDGIDSKSELAHRIMLINIVRLLGAIKKQKESRGFDTRPAQIMLPMSPNHGVFGNDGLYAESKIGLETLFERWYSESWAPYLSICGAVIGWTRGTGLMADNNIVAAGIEKHGLRTFSQAEMAFYMLAILSRPIVQHNELEPIYVDLTGGMGSVPNLKALLSGIRSTVTQTSEIIRALASEEAQENKVVAGDKATTEDPSHVKPQANIAFTFPKILNYDKDLAELSTELKGMVDLDRVVVVTGFAEVGPYGNSRTRWEMEAYGRFSLEGCVEMAWIMGLIKNHNGPLGAIEHYTGWVDAKTSKAIPDCEVKAVYEAQILEHTGIRLIEPELDEGYDPNKKQGLQEIILEADLAPFTVPQEMAAQFQLEHGDLADIFKVQGSEDYSVQLKKGATLLVPKAMKFDRSVAGQIPTGWDARTYGISEDTIQQVDRVTLYALVSTVEALLSSGITDPYELYKYMHVSEIGNCVGSGLGGMSSQKKMYKTRFLDKPVANDVLQESFINTTAAWINMLILSSSGPIRTPVGACATSIESLETGFETIVSGKAKMCLVGGFDDMTEAVAYEFANMKATSNTESEIAAGRDPKEMCRPTSTTRNGFMEAQGGGIQVITSARVAIDMGLPIHGIVAWVGTSSDKIGRSIPAPGRGILGNARESTSKFPSPLLDIKYRRRRLEMRQQQIRECLELEMSMTTAELAALSRPHVPSSASERVINRMDYIKSEAAKQEKEALNTFGNAFYHSEPSIAPIRGALAVWGLSIDDLDVASFHGTSTVKNDQNETEVIQSQLKHLGRKDGNPLLGIFQKHLTGHSKGGAGAWMLNGCMQVLDTGLVPGNRNADNVDAKLEKNDFIVYPNRSIQTAGVKAFSVTSFGFGQKGAQAIGVHAKYLLATLGKQEYEAYVAKLEVRIRKAEKFFQKGLVTNKLFIAKNEAPYTKEQESMILLNPEARVSESGKGDELWYADEELARKLF